MNKIQNILVPVDFSPESKHALASAISLARETHSRLTVLHVFDKTAKEYRQAALDSFAALHGTATVTATEPTVDRWLREKSLDLYNFIRSASPGPVQMVIKQRIDIGSPVANILRVATEENTDLIVLALKHRGLFPYLMGRSILLKLTLRSRFSVLLIGVNPGLPALPTILRRLFTRNVEMEALHMGTHAASATRS
jgi:nucleotide-binding universal stress UspA family protein